MNAMLLGQGNDAVAVEVGGGRAEGERVWCARGMLRGGIRVGVQRRGADAQAGGGAVDAQGNLASVGDDDRGNWRD